MRCDRAGFGMCVCVVAHGAVDRSPVVFEKGLMCAN